MSAEPTTSRTAAPTTGRTARPSTGPTTGPPARPPARGTGGGVDPGLAVAARPLLAQFNVAGVLDAADVHVADRLGRLTGESDERVLLAVALAVRGVRAGAVCVDLADAESLAVADAADEVQAAAPGPAAGPAGEPVAGALPWPPIPAWSAAIGASPLVAVGVDGPADRPVRWVGGRLYLDRYWRHEQVVRREVDGRLAAEPFTVDTAALAAAVHRHFPDAARPDARVGASATSDNSRQRLAATTAALSRVTVLTGGPGTGKTTTIARLLAVLQEVAGPDLRVALAAPTGKAAARLQESIGGVVRGMDEADRARVGAPAATTIHRLLGWRPGSSTRFRHDAAHRLPHDVVVVDETSMVSLPLMARLLEALRPQTRLVLVGDPDQLASVEAGAVLGDLVRRPPVADGLPDRLRAVVPADVPHAPDDLTVLRNGVVRLTETYRYGARLGRLAEAIRQGDAESALAELRAGSDAASFVETGERLTDVDLAGVRADVVATGVALTGAARAGDAAQALRALEEHRLLLAHRRGPAGVAHWAAVAEEWVAEAVGPAADGPWPPGLPLLVTANDRDTGLYNGDTGVVVADGAGGTVVAFGDPDQPRLVRPHRLPAVQPVHAMTVHRGQGSQFRRVSVLLPPPGSPLLTRELLYTAVTRAREHVRVVGTEAAVRAAVGRPIRRASGLQEPL
ncbi:exodeoxyribonuclease V subunit alpha [Cellulomonas aerilata]|uniref:RecBCD enzyme subunit RecD n=1 Tax=Cellulomonas aerilata TaxID=515326 RepID=A0A512D7D8_9CELL|nr:exodeoxyribonuclease V subunit alpha [Cellulomonas aerilata]GEO32393.1 RecBCD enzyme subunit RecD [Cellulomonas aerilata]